MKKIILLKFLLLMFCAGEAWAQTKTITGKLTSSDNAAPLPGVNILVTGSSIGTTSDADGNYSISATENDVLVFSFIGYTTKEILVGSQTMINVAMDADLKQLSEVIVVGYGTQEKRDLTGNISRITSSSLQNVPVTSIEQSMQGKAAGVFIESQNGKLGQGVKVRIRGASSLSASNQPLYVVDGIPITTASQSSNGAETNPLSDLNFNDVASVEILKDASASAIYGSRAANGVVLITTKRGKSGKTNFTLNFLTGSSRETGRRQFLNAQQYVQMETDAAQRAFALDPSFDYVAYNTSRLTRYSAGNTDYLTGKVNTNWQDQVFRAAPFNQIDLSASGGNDKTKFYVSGQYLDQKGILIGNSLKRLSARVNVDHQATEKLSFGVNFNIARTENHRLSNDDFFSTPLQIVALSPITPIIDPRTNLLSGLLDPNTGNPNTNFPVYYNPLISVNNARYVATVYRGLGNVYAQYKILPGLTFRSEEGFDFLLQTEDEYLGAATVRDTGTPNGYGKYTTTIIANVTTNNFLRYEKQFDQHSFDIVGGMAFQKSSNTGSSMTAQQYPSDGYSRALNAPAQILTIGGGPSDFSFLSYFARSNYKLKDRYLLSLSGRVDGSSRFGASNRYGFFPAASAGWIISEEPFMKDIPVLSFLKLRASYGLTGNAEISNFSARGLYGPANYVGQGGQAPIQLINKNLKWETTAQTDIGIDFGFLDGRISVEADYYLKSTHDLLLFKALPGTSGFSTYTQNIGSLENKGFELVINSQNLVGEFKWSTSLNIANTRNKVTNLGGQILGTNDLNRAMEGQPIGVFYGRQFAGADPNNGDAVYVLNTKNPDGSINKTTTNDFNAAQQVVLGNPNPRWYGGITNTFSYKGFDLSILFQGVQGNKIYNSGGQYMSASASNGFDNQTPDQLNAWKNPGDKTSVPELRMFFGNGVNPSNRWLSDGSYLRLKTLTLGYNLPKSVASKFKVDKIRIYFTGQNLLTFTSYKGWDPEVNADYQASNINQGVDFYSAPQPKTFTAGLNLSF
ncbi:MAG TPA: SusC/RagA family TonB-linked outer membrane protein [Cytophagales bacterium]|nr:SusC/RagA family TonB-linked outer membrane protein [Cytophagales bacterium]